jgi:hypothetical protein
VSSPLRQAAGALYASRDRTNQKAKKNRNIEKKVVSLQKHFKWTL